MEPMNPSGEGVNPLKLEQLQRELADRIESAVRDYEASSETEAPVELDINFEGPDGEDAHELQQTITGLVNDFYNQPEVADANLRVHKVTVIDSDTDGDVAVNVQYTYPE